MAKSSAYSRRLFEAAKAKYKIVPAPHFLRAEQVITNDKSSYLFNFKTTNDDLRTESKLDPNDLFITTGLGFFIEREAVGFEGAGVLASYPGMISSTDNTKFNPLHLEALYNGYFQITTGQTVTIEKLPALLFRNVPQQEGGQFKLEDLLYAGGEDILFDGGKTQQVKLEVPTFANILVASEDATKYRNKVVLFAFGYILKGAGYKK